MPDNGPIPQWTFEVQPTALQSGWYVRPGHPRDRAAFAVQRALEAAEYVVARCQVEDQIARSIHLRTQGRNGDTPESSIHVLVGAFEEQASIPQTSAKQIAAAYDDGVVLVDRQEYLGFARRMCNSLPTLSEALTLPGTVKYELGAVIEH